jgi:LysM repeat protein
MYQEQGERQRAKKELSETIRLNPKLALPRVFLSAILETEGESREAQRELDIAISLSPASVNVGYGMEDFYFKEGKNNDILTHVRKRKKKAPKALVTRAMPVKKIPPPREEMAPPSAPEKTTVPGGAAGGFGRGIEAKEMPPGRAPPGREAEEERIDPNKPGAYRVRPGDTIAKIARRFGTTSAVLMGLNTTRIEHPTVLDAGIVIRVPEKSKVRRKIRKKPSRRRAKKKRAARRKSRKRRAAIKSYRTHRVKRGDTLLKIARRYKTNAKLLMRLNRNTIEHPSFLEVGSKIKIPGSKKKRKKRRKKTALRKKRRKKSRAPKKSPKKSTPAKKQAS